MHSRAKQVKLLGERWLPIAGILRLLFAHHVDHLDPFQDRTGTARGLKPEHGADPPLSGTMILLDPIVEVATLTDADRLVLLQL